METSSHEATSSIFTNISGFRQWNLLFSRVELYTFALEIIKETIIIVIIMLTNDILLITIKILVKIVISNSHGKTQQRFLVCVVVCP